MWMKEAVLRFQFLLKRPGLFDYHSRRKGLGFGALVQKFAPTFLWGQSDLRKSDKPALSTSIFWINSWDIKYLSWKILPFLTVITNYVIIVKWFDPLYAKKQKDYSTGSFQKNYRRISNVLLLENSGWYMRLRILKLWKTLRQIIWKNWKTIGKVIIVYGSTINGESVFYGMKETPIRLKL